MSFNTYYEKTYKKYRKEFFKVVNDLESDTANILNDTNSEIDQLSLFYGNDQESFRLSLENVIKISLGLYVGKLIIQNTKALGKNKDYALELTKPYNSTIINKTIEANYQDVLRSSYGNRLLNRKFPNSDITLGANIKTIEGNALRTTRRILKVGFDEGKSAKQIASDIKNFIKKDDRKNWVSPFEWYRKANGTKLARQPILDRRGGSLDYQTMRIARTEINYTWRHATINIHEGMPYMRGWEWRLSNSHKTPDICDDWAAASPYKSKRDIPDGHPNCLCAILPILIDPNDL